MWTTKRMESTAAFRYTGNSQVPIGRSYVTQRIISQLEIWKYKKPPTIWYSFNCFLIHMFFVLTHSSHWNVLIKSPSVHMLWLLPSIPWHHLPQRDFLQLQQCPCLALMLNTSLCCLQRVESNISAINMDKSKQRLPIMTTQQKGRLLQPIRNSKKKNNSWPQTQRKEHVPQFLWLDFAKTRKEKRPNIW